MFLPSHSITSSHVPASSSIYCPSSHLHQSQSRFLISCTCLRPTTDRVECLAPAAALLELSALRVIDLNLNNLTELPLAFCTMPNLGEPMFPPFAKQDAVAAHCRATFPRRTCGVSDQGCRHANRIADGTCSTYASQHHPRNGIRHNFDLYSQHVNDTFDPPIRTRILNKLRSS